MFFENKKVWRKIHGQFGRIEKKNENTTGLNTFNKNA